MILDAYFWFYKLYHIWVLLLFALFLCVVIFLAYKRIKKLLKLQKSKPSPKYVASRVKAYEYFNENFDGILSIARKINNQQIPAGTDDSTGEGLASLTRNLQKLYEELIITL